MQIGVILIIIVITITTLLALSRIGPLIASKQRQLFYRHRFRSLSNLSGREADKALDRQVARLKKKFPGRKSEWYFDKAVYDLERDRRA